MFAVTATPATGRCRNPWRSGSDVTDNAGLPPSAVAEQITDAMATAPLLDSQAVR
jgi:hypothetical protein